MALVKCGECGRDISDSAEACPHCGKKRGIGLKFKLVIVVAIAVFLILFVLVQNLTSMLKQGM